jgi:hypothetical protein
MAKAKASYIMTEKVFLYPGESANWHFVPVTKKIGQEIKQNFGKYAKGFGSLPVEVTIGKTTWQTSIFPDKYSGSYILPLKAQVRKKEDVMVGEKITYRLSLR